MQFNVEDIADNADMIINGYAFTKDKEYVRILNLNCINMTIFLIKTEEVWLKDLYGQEYIEYCKKVNRCIPWVPKKR